MPETASLGRAIRVRSAQGTRTRVPTGPTAGGLVRVGFALGLAVTGTLAQQTIETQPPADYVRAGERAMEWTKRFVSLGPRPAGSPQLRRQSEMIVAGLSTLSCSVEVDDFIAATPKGAIPMRNILAKFGPAGADPVIVISGHYDTKDLPGFVGANDGGSSAALLMTLAERAHGLRQDGIWIAFFDGEESLVAWRGTDHTYGSRRLARKWHADGTAARIAAVVNVDMIGDADLRLIYDGYADQRLREQVWGIASELGYQTEFGRSPGYVQDDHLSFVEVGIPALNLIDFEYGPGNVYWHSPEDSMDKLSARSLAIILHVLDILIERGFPSD